MCKSVDTSITNCSEYDSDQTCVKCSNDTLYPSDEGKICCSVGKVFDGKVCTDIEEIYSNCNDKDTQTTYVCKACKEGFYLSNNICVEQS